MRVTGKRAAFAAAAAVLFAGQTAEAQWGDYGGYFHAPAGGPPAYTQWSSRYSLHGSPCGCGVTPYAPSYPSYGVLPYGGAPYNPVPYGGMPYGGYSLGNPRGELEYDVYTPFGRQEYEYEFRRNGRIDFDLDD